MRTQRGWTPKRGLSCRTRAAGLAAFVCAFNFLHLWPVASLHAERRPGGAWAGEAAWRQLVLRGGRGGGGRPQLRLRGGLRAEPPLREASGEGGAIEASSPEGASGCLSIAPAENRTLRRPPTAVGLEVSRAEKDGQPPQDKGPGEIVRYVWNAKRRVWLLFKRPDEDLSIETLRGRWNFAPSDCLTFRHRLPDKWQHVDWAPGWRGWLEFFFFMTPILNQLLYLWRGLFPCAVCGRARSAHPIARYDI